MAELGDLNRIMRGFGARVVANTNKTVRQTALAIDAILVGPPQQGGTPVDTGRARSNWLPSLGTPRTDTVEAGETPSIERVTAGRIPGQTIFIANNLPYIQLLNEGSSKQAPAMFVEMAIKAGEKVIGQARLLKK